MSSWLTTRFAIDLNRPRVMGIVNVTPDSFSDGGPGLYARAELPSPPASGWAARAQTWLDAGGECTRSGARPPSKAEERSRVMPVLRHAPCLGVPVSVDTRGAALMREALDAGADIINDVHALRGQGAEAVLAAFPHADICLMHMRGEPATSQDAPAYADVSEVHGFLARRTARLRLRCIAARRIVPDTDTDTGIGFGKTLDHNIALHRALDQLLKLEFPVLVCWSRKSALGTITGNRCKTAWRPAGPQPWQRRSVAGPARA